MFLGGFGGEPLAWDMWWDEFGYLFHKYDITNTWVNNLAFLDDITLIATNMAQLQQMLNDIQLELEKLGLSLNTAKVEWIGNKIVCDRDSAWIEIGDSKIFKSSAIKVLGSMIREDLKEGMAFEHRIHCGWACYRRWSHILESSASIASRVVFWEKTVLHSLLWGLQTTRAQNIGCILERLLSCQKCMFRKMLKSKRRPGETWLDWHKRSFRRVGEIMLEHNSNVLDKLHNLKQNWAGHCVRFGLRLKEPHVLKAIMFWRPLTWWRYQQLFNDHSENRVTHEPQQGVPKRWDSQFSSNWAHVLASDN